MPLGCYKLYPSVYICLYEHLYPNNLQLLSDTLELVELHWPQALDNSSSRPLPVSLHPRLVRDTIGARISFGCLA